MRSRAKSFDKLRAFCEGVPLVDCHDHTGACGPKYTDAIVALTSGYVHSDLTSASSDKDAAFLHDTSRSLDERWPVLERAWNRTKLTGYAQVTRRLLKRFYGEDELSLAALKRVQRKLVDTGDLKVYQQIGSRLLPADGYERLDTSDPKVYEKILAEANIAVRLGDIWHPVAKVLDGSLALPPRTRLVIGLPGYHAIRDYNAVQAQVAPLARTVTSLDEYLAACRELFAAHQRFGAVAFKDQSAYARPIDYGNPTRAEAEAVFNWFMADPRRSAAYPDGQRPLGDFLFHEFMRMARDLDLPVQIHTGHMAGIRNEIAKTNAVGLTSVLELHRDVRFDLFHANWPYSAELLYLGKNYPNVTLDFCWANIIDPVYCQNLFRQALAAVPHGKIHGYGSDYVGNVEYAWAHAQIARDNLAIALADLVDAEYLDVDEAKEVARAWLFNNANDFFRLALPPA